MRRIGGGNKRKYRIIDFKRNRLGQPATVREIEYDPNRSARIALVQYEDGEKRYILHPKGLKVGEVIYRGPGADIRLGSARPAGEIPLGTRGPNARPQSRQGGGRCRRGGRVRGRGCRTGCAVGWGCCVGTSAVEGVWRTVEAGGVRGTQLYFGLAAGFCAATNSLA